MKNITGLGHVAIKVKDVERAMAFYSGVLGLREMLRLYHDDGSLFLVYVQVTDNEYIEIFPNAANDRAPGIHANGVHHFCLRVDEIETTVEKLRAKNTRFVAWGEGGLNPVEEPVISNGLDGNRQCWIEDPDGNRIELMEMAENCLQYQGVRRLREEAALAE